MNSTTPVDSRATCTYPALSAVVAASLIREQLLFLYQERATALTADALARALHGKDLMALGALADALRAAEVGDVVKISVQRTSAMPATLAVRPSILVEGEGIGLLRAVAEARVSRPVGTTIAVDYGRVGIELAQVALGFGANALVGAAANKRGLPIAQDASRKVKGKGMVALTELHRQELERVLLGARRRALFDDGISEVSHGISA